MVSNPMFFSLYHSNARMMKAEQFFRGKNLKPTVKLELAGLWSDSH